MFKFFINCKILQDVKSQYRALVYLYHPDRQNGDLEIMKQVNNEYEQVFEYVKNNPINEQEKKSYYYANVNDGYREQIEKIIFIPEISIEICGSWVWLNGNTKPVKDIIKDAGFSWAFNKKAWFWKPYAQKGYKHKAWDMEKIRNTYGSEKVESQERVKVTT